MVAPVVLVPSVHGNVARKAAPLVTPPVYDDFGVTLLREDVTEKIEVWCESSRNDQESF
jgi:hypothetical protein